MTVLVQKTFSTTCTGDLHQAIQDNVTIVTNLEQIVYAGGATTDFYFANALSGPEDTELDNVLAAWVCPTPSDTQVDDQEFDDTASADPNVVWSSDKTETEYVNETGDSMEGNLDMDGAEVRIHKTGDFGNYWSLGFNAATGAPEIGRSNTSGTMILMPDSPNCQWIFGSNAAGTIATYIDCDNNGKLRFNTLHTGSIVIGLGGLEAYNNATPIGASGSPFGSAFVTNLDVEVDGQIDGNLRIGEGFASTHTLSVQSNTADTHIEILNNGGTGKGALLGMENSLTVNDLGIYNYQSGPICFYTDTSDSSGQRRMVIQPDGDVEIKSLTAGAVKSAADGTLSSDAAITDLSDVFSSMSPNDGEVLTYDTTNGWQAEIPSSGVTDHGLLSGLGDDDHVQYHNDTRGDARYYTKTQVDALTWDASDIVSGTFDNARIAASNVTQHVGAIDHDSLLNFVADEHIDWTVDQGATNIESNNIDVGRSIVVAGGELRLDGDLVSPGNDKVYGTNGSGVKGWYDAPTAAVWGNITGTLSNQTDLQTALDGKADSSHTHAASEVTSGTFADARISESSVTQHEGAIDHDALTNFVAAEHIRWDLTGAEDIHVDRITAGAVTQHEASIDHDALTNTHNLTTDIDHDSLTNYVAQEHIRWDLTGAEDVHVDRITAGAVTQHEGSIDHDALTNFVANEHVDHSSITITAGNGLTGGGTIDSNVTINANTQNSVEVSVDALQLVGDTASPGNNKVYGTNGSGTRGWYDAASGTGDVTAAANIVDHSIIRGDGGAKGVQDSEQGTTSWTIADNGKMVGVGDNSGDYIMTIRNLNATSGDGFSVQAGEALGDLAFSIQDSDGSFIIMECEADQGYVTFGKSYAQTLTDNGAVYGIDNQNTVQPGSADINTQVGQYKIGGTPIPLKTYTFFMDQVDYPRGADWSVSNGAPASRDTNNSAFVVRRFDDTVAEAIGFIVRVPDLAKEMTVRTKMRAETGAASVVAMQLHRRVVADNAAIGGWNTSTLTLVNTTVDERWQVDVSSNSLTNWNLQAGEVAQMQLSRNPVLVADTLVGDATLLMVEIEFR